LTQVGGSLDYVVTVTNDGTGKARDLVVLDNVPPEVEVTSVPNNDAVKSTQLGRSPNGSDIVWILDLAGGQSLDLRWSGTPVLPGDLVAANDVRATLDGDVVARAGDRSFLAQAASGPTENPPPPMVKRKVVTFVEVPVAPSAIAPSITSAPAPGSSLPATGSDLVSVYLAAGLFIGIGLVLVLLGRRRSLRTSRSVVILLLVFATACVSSSTPDGDEGPQPGALGSPSAPGDDADDGTEAGEDDEVDEDDGTKVKGKRIRRDPDNETPPDGTEPGSTEPGSTEPGDGMTDPFLPAEPRTEIVREVETVRVPQELPVVQLEDKASDNGLSFTWSEQDGIQTAASSLFLTPGANAPLITTLDEVGGNIRIEAAITNNARDARLHVDGRVFLDVSGNGGTTRLRSDQIDVVLNPKGSTTAVFTFLLPTGDYGVSATFQQS
jgi:LPXTG-motif cell wall-anchored protein/uncharacterized repeat protein (TIGR01451 family)